MDFSVASFSSIFPARELRRYRNLFRSRNFIKSRDCIVANQSANSNIVHHKELSVLIYMSRGPLSSKKRAILRKNFAQLFSSSEHFSAPQVKFSLLPTTLSQFFTSSTYLNKRRFLLKGSSFQRIITFKDFSIKNESLAEEAAFYSYIKKQISLFFENLKKLNTLEGNTISCNPTIFFFPSNGGSVVPRRFDRTKGYIQETLTYEEIIKSQVGQLTSIPSSIPIIVNLIPVFSLQNLMIAQQLVFNFIQFSIKNKVVLHNLTFSFI